METLVSATWLLDRLGQKRLVVADVRWNREGTARDAYDAGHIPGAIFVDVDADLAAEPSPIVGRHPLPDPETFAATMGRLGIGDKDVVVAYDDTGGSNAARLWWMLSASGHPATVLDGGIQAWKGPLQKGAIRSGAETFTGRPWPEDRVIDADGVANSLVDGNVVLDARRADRYAGKVEPFDPVAGHIPGAKSAPWEDNLGEDGRFLPPKELRDRFEKLGISSEEPSAVYCGSGVTACHDILAIQRAGLGRARLYDGSWSGWCSDASRPVATGKAKGKAVRPKD